MACTVAITGGIGSGKSAVCKCLTAMGLPVYDCDSRASAIMDADTEIHRRIADEIAPEAILEGRIDRRHLASVVFNDPEKLSRLNSIVHGAVRDDIRHWKSLHYHNPVIFIETAILLESGLHRLVDRIWVVTARREVRLARACRRDNASPEAITARMERQRIPARADVDVPLYEIDNNGQTPLLPRIFDLLADIIDSHTLRRWKS